MLKSQPAHLTAVLQALLVTFLWATSWVLIKIGLKDIPALTFAGLRYSAAFLCLLPFALRANHRVSLQSLSRRQWGSLLALGLFLYAVTQGAQFLGLAYLPAVTVNLLLNFTTIIVMFLGMAFLAEQPTILQWSGVGLSLAGMLVFFYPAALPADQAFGVSVVVVGVLSNALSAILGRRVNREGDLHPLIVTTISMGFGSLALLTTGLLVQGLPRLSLLNWAFIAWLAVVNTAVAFTLWNHTLRTLAALESSIINSTMLIHIPLLAWLFLGEPITIQKVVGMALAGLGALIVQTRRA